MAPYAHSHWNPVLLTSARTGGLCPWPHQNSPEGCRLGGPSLPCCPLQALVQHPFPLPTAPSGVPPLGSHMSPKALPESLVLVIHQILLTAEIFTHLTNYNMNPL